MVSVLAQIAVTLVAWFILMLVCTNLLGFLVRGFFVNQEMENIASGSDIIMNEYKRSVSTNKYINIIAFGLIIIFLVLLYRFWNIWLVLSALLLIVSRLPDLIWEIRHRRKLQATDMDRPRFYLISTALSWVSLPVVWYALYRL
ncbi:MAG TPA: hypothetical protein VGF77_02020 [Allosphingosinicella sp.]|jgi:hypothetical protein